MNSNLENLNEKPLLENLKKSINTGVIPVLNPVEDLFYKKDYAVNSFFSIGHFEVEGHTLNFLYQVMITVLPNSPSVVNSNISITDETTGWYYADDKIFPLEMAEITEIGDGADKKFCIKVPNGCFLGNLDTLHVEAEMPHGSINVDMKAYGTVIYNAGSGNFPTILGENFNQYSVPNMVTNGTLTLDDKTYNVSGKSWFDRQWQNEGSNLGAKWNWSWMDINLDNGDVISLWDMRDITHETNYAWATILHPDGSQTVAAMEPLTESASDYWTSTESGQKYPTHWIVKIPDLDAALEVTSVIKEQEIVSQVPFLNKYEGASTVKGTYKGKEITGYCYVELLGIWN